jgi:hypothetical protein
VPLAGCSVCFSSQVALRPANDKALGVNLAYSRGVCACMCMCVSVCVCVCVCVCVLSLYGLVPVKPLSSQHRSMQCTWSMGQDSVKSYFAGDYPIKVFKSWKDSLRVSNRAQDISAANVLLASNPESADSVGFVAKLGDFGLARKLGGRSAAFRGSCGTITHSAPELFEESGASKVPSHLCNNCGKYNTTCPVQVVIIAHLVQMIILTHFQSND